MPVTVITITHPETVAQLSEYLGRQAGEARRGANDLARYLKAVAGGVLSASVVVGTDAVRASGTATFESVAATDTLTVNGVAFACVASGATGNQFNVGASDTISAANCAAKINAAADATIAGKVTASAADGVITITAVDPGVAGNVFTLAQSGDHITLSEANLENGSNGTVTTYDLT